MCPNGCRLDRSEAPGEGMYSTARHHSGNFEQNVPEKPKKAGKPKNNTPAASNGEKSTETPEKPASPPAKEGAAPEKPAEKSAGEVDNSGLF